LPPKILREVEDVRNSPLLLSAISFWEISKKHSLNKLELSLPVQQWLLNASRSSGLNVVPLTPEIAYESSHLPGKFHKDPADEIIVATARILEVTLITADKRIQRYPNVKTLWR
jgi:PIN domain nuclease of toxin-antitoxin system